LAQVLAAEGIEQAKNARAWIDANLGGVASFDVRYVSSYLRARQTVLNLSDVDSDVGWIIDDRLSERSWGVYGTFTEAQRKELFPRTVEMHKRSAWYTRLDGGDNMPDVHAHVRDFQGTLHREWAGKRVFVGAHGELINVARYSIERMIPEQWEAINDDPAYDIRNCSILHYSRVNPEDPGDIREKITWRRMIYTDAVDESPDGGEWVQIPPRHHYTNRELLAQIAIAPPILPGGQT
jgi:broad specificity phosphatase PhoE